MAIIIIRNGSSDGSTGVLKIGLGYLQDKAGSNAHGVRELVLKPGLNEVDVEEWVEAKKLEVVQGMIDEERLVEMSGAPLAEHSVPKALKMIRECNDKAMLTKWLDKENRPSVLANIQKQLKRFEPPTPPATGRR